jgi:hypothetical protein
MPEPDESHLNPVPEAPIAIPERAKTLKFIDRAILWPQGLTAREGEQLAGELATPRRGSLCCRNQVADSAVGRQGAGQQLEVANDNQQQVVEVMSHTAGKLTDRFHFLGLPQRIFCLSSLRDFMGNTLFQGFIELP